MVHVRNQRGSENEGESLWMCVGVNERAQTLFYEGYKKKITGRTASLNHEEFWFSGDIFCGGVFTVFPSEGFSFIDMFVFV